MFVVKYRKIFFILTALLALASVFFIIYDGLKFSIDFTGGSVLEIEYTEEVPKKEMVEGAVDSVVEGGFVVRPVEDRAYNISTPFLKEEQYSKLMQNLNFEGQYGFVENKFTSVGPIIGEELKNKSGWAILIVVVAIILFIAFAFRKVSRPISSWTYGLVAIMALIHDILIPFGVFALLGVLLGAEIDILFVTALLAILGYSVNDTIVVFDRIRENLRHNQEFNVKESFEQTVGRSLNQTFLRSIFTSFTTAIVLLALFVLGGEITRYFSLTLLVGIIAGTYSSIFFASPMLVAINNWKKNGLDK